MNQTKIYQNAMELLVDQEVKRQLAQLPQKFMTYINLSEVATYALNRLPPLYSYSEEGWRQQKLRGENKLSHQIRKAIRQAFLVVAGDIVLHSMPLEQENLSENYFHQKRSTTSTLPHGVSSSRISAVKVTQSPKVSLPENTDVWGNSFYLR